MQWSTYREVWAYPAVRQAALLGFLGKAPWFGAGLLLTLHVVEGLGESYAAAGLVTAVFTLAVAVSSPWRGRLLDTVGLRRTLAPSLIVLPVVFGIAPLVGYWPLLIGMAVVGLLAVPWFVLTRQMILAAVPVEQRRTGLALDSVLTELGFIVGPTAGVLAAVYWDTGLALATFALLSMAGAAALTWANPPLVATADVPEPEGLAAVDEAAVPEEKRGGLRAWMNGAVITTFVANVAVTFTLAGTDLSIVAATRAMDVTALLGLVMAVWAVGSLIGGLAYGGTTGRPISLTLLVGGLGVTTMLGALGTNPWLLMAMMAVAGLFCAPSLAATVERLSHAVEERYRGEAMGWQGTFATLGNAMAPPVVGWTIDTLGWQAGFLATGGVGLVLAALGWVTLRIGRRVARASRAQARTA